MKRSFRTPALLMGLALATLGMAGCGGSTNAVVVPEITGEMSAAEMETYSQEAVADTASSRDR